MIAQDGGAAAASGHDPVVPRPLRGGVLGVDARQARQVVRRERDALRTSRGLLGLRARAEEGAGSQGEIWYGIISYTRGKQFHLVGRWEMGPSRGIRRMSRLQTFELSSTDDVSYVCDGSINCEL